MIIVIFNNPFRAVNCGV